MATATSIYRASMTQARDRMRRIGKALDGHATRQRETPKDYGFAGDLSHVNHLLDQIERFLGLED